MKRQLLLIGLACCAMPSAALAKGGWIADPKTGCQIKNPLPIPDEAVLWSGECKDGKASAPGKLLWLAKNKLFLTIEGIFEDGQCRRNCAVSTETGNKYLGEMLDNRPDGSGTMTYADGTKYSGSWSGGKKHGKGVFTAKDGSSQEETWEHGKQIPDAPH
ncbi:hypothetical protein [Candidatus Electronema sp. JC]|uniref:hypothetical protein n=1 Tax=Candidatus Electronema sp. JC TaxID=3401570 RepID=UPI003B4312A7